MVQAWREVREALEAEEKEKESRASETESVGTFTSLLGGFKNIFAKETTETEREVCDDDDDEEKEKKGNKEGQSERAPEDLVWRCEFCSHVNDVHCEVEEIPKASE